MTGIRAELRVDNPVDCPIAGINNGSGVTSSISRSHQPESTVVTEEFMFDSDTGIEDDRIEEVFSYGSRDVYRFTREKGRGCACELVEEHGCPVVDVRTRHGSIHMTFHSPDVGTLKDVLKDLRTSYDEVGVQRLVRSKSDETPSELVYLNREKLTDRQEEVLETAHRMGYFIYPKEANAGEVANELGISTSTFTEHLAAAQRKILNEVLDVDGD